MQIRGSRLSAGFALALACALHAAPASAQSASDFRLPPGKASPTPRPPGPVDSDNPVVAAPRVAPSAVPASPAPSPTPVQPSASATPAPGPRTIAPRPAIAPRTSVPAAAPVTGPATPPPGDPAALPFPTATPAAPIPQAAPSLPPVTSDEGSGWPVLPLLGGVTLAFAALAAWLWRRRRADLAEPEVDFVAPVVTRPAPVPAPMANGIEAEVVAAETGLGMALDATRLSATLLNTTLQYRLRLTNHTGAPLGPIAVSGDMVAAHAALPVEQQLGLDGGALEFRHQSPGLDVGESIVLSGEFRLPLAAINPIRAGSAALFVPLARFRAETGPATFVRTFVVGETPGAADAGLRPFRLDLGPRVYSRIGQREVVLPA